MKKKGAVVESRNLKSLHKRHLRQGLMKVVAVVVVVTMLQGWNQQLLVDLGALHHCHKLMGEVQEDV